MISFITSIIVIGLCVYWWNKKSNNAHHAQEPEENEISTEDVHGQPEVATENPDLVSDSKTKAPKAPKKAPATKSPKAPKHPKKAIKQ